MKQNVNSRVLTWVTLMTAWVEWVFFFTYTSSFEIHIRLLKIQILPTVHKAKYCYLANKKKITSKKKTTTMQLKEYSSSKFHLCNRCKDFQLKRHQPGTTQCTTKKRSGRYVYNYCVNKNAVFASLSTIH